MRSGIYAIKNTENGKMYVGSSIYLRKRFSAHRSALGRGKHPSHKLQAAWNKYGETAFKFCTLLVCGPENLLMYEQLAIDRFSAATVGYNITPVAGSHLGAKRSPESCKRLALARLGHRHSDEARKKISIAHKGTTRGFQPGNQVNVGRIISDETKAKISASLMGNKSCLGWVPTAEHRSKISAAMMGNKRRVGTVHSDETKAAISATIRKNNYKKRLPTPTAPPPTPRPATGG